MEACCTCARVLDRLMPRFTETEKPLPDDRRLECCTRVICGSCIHSNARFSNYCPFCQISSGPSTLPQGLKEPPSYQTSIANKPRSPPPPYSPKSQTDAKPPSTRLSTADPQDEKAALAAADEETDQEPPAEDTLHFLNHTHDSIPSLSLRYGVPAHVLRQTNKLSSDHLLLARRTILIPGAWYKGGVSHSPRPVDGEEEEIRKGKIRRWMVATKVSDYDVAVLYLENAGYDMQVATDAYFADEAWERDNPLGENDDRTRRLTKGKATAPSGDQWRRASQVAFLRRAGPSNR